MRFRLVPAICELARCHAGGRQLASPLIFACDFRGRWAKKGCRRATIAWNAALRVAVGLNGQMPRRNHGCQFCVAELFEQSKHVAIQWLLPDSFAGAKVSADTSRRNSCV